MRNKQPKHPADGQFEQTPGSDQAGDISSAGDAAIAVGSDPADGTDMEGAAAPAFVARGSNGQVEAYTDRVVIRRKGFMGVAAQGIRGDRRLYYSDLRAIEYKKPTMMANGYIQFINTAEMATGSNTSRIGTTNTAALHDPNTVTLRAFKKENVEAYERLHEYVMSRIAEEKARSRAAAARTAAPAFSEADEIAKFKRLLDDGVITKEEFDAKRKKLLGL